MKIKINSDFWDYYDHQFAGSHDTADVVLERRGLDTFHRYFNFVELENMGYKVPHYEIAAPSSTSGVKVAHRNPYQHSGHGKSILNTPRKGLVKPMLLVDYIEPVNVTWKPTSYRLLKIGKSLHYLRYQSDDEFRSNCGNVEVEKSSVTLPYAKQLDNYPLVAIDFVLDKAGDLWAIDLNRSPSWRTTFLEEELKSKEVYRLIEEFYEEKG